MPQKLFSFCLTLLLVQPLFAQENTCDCCAYYTFYYPNIINPERVENELYPQHIIQESNTKNFTYYTVDKYRKKTYKAAHLEFDEEGYLIQKTTFYRGNPLNRRDYEIDPTSKKTLTETLYYLDENEKPSSSIPPNTTTYTYNNDGLLISEEIQNGIMNEYSYTVTYQYDDNNRLILESNSMATPSDNYEYRMEYNDENNSVHKYYILGDTIQQTTVSFYDVNQNIIKRHIKDANNEIKYSTTWQYDDQGNMIAEYSFLGDITNDPYREKRWFYNDKGLLSQYSMAGAPEGECPDQGNFTETYKYNSKDILTQVIHEFDGNKCIIKLKK